MGYKVIVEPWKRDYNILISGLKKNVDIEELRKVLEKYGEIKKFTPEDNPREATIEFIKE